VPGRRFQREQTGGEYGDPKLGPVGATTIEVVQPGEGVRPPRARRMPKGRPGGSQLALAEEVARLPASWRRDRLYRWSLAFADLTAAALALSLAIVVFGDDRITPALLLGMPLVVLVAKVVGLYDRDEHLVKKTTLDEAPALFQVATLYTLLIWLGESSFIVEPADVNRELGHSQVLGVWGLLFVSMLGARTISRAVVRMVTPPERCLVFGSSEAAEGIEKKFRVAHGIDAQVVGRVPLEQALEGANGAFALGDVGGLQRLTAEHGIERVIIAPTQADSDQLLGAIQLVKSIGVKVSVLPRLFEVVGSSVMFDDVDGLTLLGVPRFGLGRSSRALKRSVDLLGSTIGLVVCAPLLLVIAVAIKLSSRGSVLFRQQRIGEHGVEFEMLKFRTMHHGADEQKAELLPFNEADGLFKIADDPRITRVGRVLRRHSLDELPQLINVLRGEMSLVGPRPLVVDDDQRVEGWHRRRLSLRPGVTGIWQVLGSARIPLNEMVKIDYLYGANWSLWLDLKILLRTVLHVLGRRGM